MKTSSLISFLVFVLGVFLTAEGAETFDRLVTKERVFHDATITSVSSSHAVVRHEGGISKVPISDLPEEIQDKLKSDAQKQKTDDPKVRAENSQRKAAEYKAALAQVAAWRSEPKTLTVQSLTSRGSVVAEVENEGTKEIRVNGLPNTAGKFFSELEATETRLITESNNLRRAVRAYEDIPAPSIYATSYDIAYLEERARRARARIHTAEEAVEQLERYRAKLLSEQAVRTSFSARKTAQRYANLEIWEYYGPPVLKPLPTAPEAMPQ